MKPWAIATAVLLILTLYGFLLPVRAHAYLDPGTGSYLFQLALATIAGGLFAIALFWRRIKVFFKNLFSKQRIDEEQDD